MPKATETSGTGRIDEDVLRVNWLARLDALAAQVKGWVEPAGWRTRMVLKTTRDGALGRFQVPLLLMERDGIQVALNPVSRFVDGTAGVVELYVVPGYEIVAPIRLGEDARWSIDDREPGAAGGGEPPPRELAEGPLISVLDRMVAEHERQI